jgi:predicted CXXCH cytochrome family protein
VKTLLKITLLMTVCLSGSAVLAFHDGGVAECAGCHTMHNSQDGQLVDPENPNGSAYLLNSGNSSDTCLSCHAGYGQFAGGAGYGAGGDFYWLTKTWTWTAHGHAYSSDADGHGHNIISPAYNLTQDATLSTAPGGDFLSQYLTCTSCHDPHGNQNFRILYDSNVGPVYNGGRYDFDADAPVAAGNSRRTVSGSGQETDLAHTVYKSGMSEWCANCHEMFHADNTTNFVHPTGEAMGSTVAAAYNAYISSDEVVGGDPATSYMGLVPFEAVNVDLDSEDFDSQNYTQGPTGVDQVMCVSCHRAHASPFSDMARWDMGETFLADSHPASLDEGATQDDLDNMYYNYTFVQNQRSLCNKCHVKDFGDSEY